MHLLKKELTIVPNLVPVPDQDRFLLCPQESPSMEHNVGQNIIFFPLPVVCAVEVVLVLSDHVEDAPPKIYWI